MIAATAQMSSHFPVPGTRVRLPAPQTPTVRAAHDPRHTQLHAVILMPPGAPRNALALALWDAGLLVTVFASPAEAEGVLVGDNVHAVVLDAQLGGAAGSSLLRWLHAAGHGQVKVVMVGEVDAITRARLLDSGVAQVVPVPANVTVFARQFAQALGAATLGF